VRALRHVLFARAYGESLTVNPTPSAAAVMVTLALALLPEALRRQIPSSRLLQAAGRSGAASRSHRYSPVLLGGGNTVSEVLAAP
jgi:hypothetical protein